MVVNEALQDGKIPLTNIFSSIHLCLSRPRFRGNQLFVFKLGHRGPRLFLFVRVWFVCFNAVDITRITLLLWFLRCFSCLLLSSSTQGPKSPPVSKAFLSNKYKLAY